MNEVSKTRLLVHLIAITIGCGLLLPPGGSLLFVSSFIAPVKKPAGSITAHCDEPTCSG
jgi:hypothetical protein